MPTLIDSLIVRLGLDSSQLVATSGPASKKLKELEGATGATEKGVKSLNKTSKETARGVEELARSVGSFLAAIGSTLALKVFVQDAIESSAAIDRLSKNLGLGASNLTAWGNAAEEVGGSSKGLQGSLMMLSREQTNLMLTGQSSLIPYFSSLGIAMTEATGKARPATDILMDLAKAAERMDRPKAHNMLAAIGLDEGTINLLLRGRAELELTLKRQKEYGDQVAKFAPEATKLQRAIVDLKQQFTLFGLSLLQQAGPSLEKFLEMLERFVSWAQANKDNIADVLKVMAIGLGAIGLALAPVDIAVVGVIALAAAIGLLWNDYKVWENGGKSLINWGQWSKEIDLAKAGIEELKKVASTAFDAIRTAAKVGLDLVNHDWKKANADLVGGTKKMNEAMGLGKNNDLDKADDHNAGRATKFLKSLWGAGDAVPDADKAIGSIEGFYAKGAKPNRPQRNHNPGDIEYGEFAKNHGATGSDGRFAIFPDDQTGFSALTALLSSPKYANKTVSQAINTFAPSNENNTKSYIQQFDKMTGAKPRDTMGSLMSGVSGASDMARTATSAPKAGGQNNDNSVENNVTVGTINVHTQATDGIGVASELGKSMDYLFASQANTGLN